jgi:hypothetical protein
MSKKLRESFSDEVKRIAGYAIGMCYLVQRLQKGPCADVPVRTSSAIQSDKSILISMAKVHVHNTQACQLSGLIRFDQLLIS